MQIEEYKGVLVFAEQQEGVLQKISFELLGKGRDLANELNAPLSAVLLGSEVEHLVEDLFLHGADIVYLVEHELLECYTTDGYSRAICELIHQERPEIVLVGATTTGRDLAPRIAAKLQTGLTADCTELALCPDTSQLLMTRPAFSGNLMATIICENHRPQMSTVRPGVFEVPETCTNEQGELRRFSPKLSPKDIRTMSMGIHKAAKHITDICEADLLVSGGRGIGGPEGFQVLHELAKELGGVVAGSRAAVDMGWIEKEYQVGQTGKTVRPTLYIACGISGAVQHLAGMQGANYIIAINKRADAPIMKIANTAIVGDYEQVLPNLLEEIKERKHVGAVCQ